MGFDLGQQYFKFLKGGAKQEEDDEVQTTTSKGESNTCYLML